MSLQKLKSVPDLAEGVETQKVSRQLFIVTSGVDGTGRAALAFAHAAQAVALQKEVTIFLVLDGGKWAFSDYGNEYEHTCFNEPQKNLAACIELGARVILCSTCNESFTELNIGAVNKKIEVGGLGDVQDFLDEPCNTVTY